jgi:hypothetical protein
MAARLYGALFEGKKDSNGKHRPNGAAYPKKNYNFQQIVLPI